MKQLSILILIIAATLSGCDQNYVFEKNVALKERQWEHNEPIQFTVEIDDTTAVYDLALNVRHTDAYPYTNLWVEITTEYPSGQTGTREEQVILGNNTRQVWLGDCMGDICDRQGKIVEGVRFSEEGEYKFTVQHIMRTDPLDHVMAVGMRLEKHAQQ